MKILLEEIDCPCCSTKGRNTLWAKENGYDAVKCHECGLIYVNPRPGQSMISEAVKTGVHRELDNGRTAIVHRVAGNVGLYRRLMSVMFADVWAQQNPISWLDIGAGYGEFVEAIASLAPEGSKVEGIEPMKPKADASKKRGLSVREGYLSDISDMYDYVSLVNVFSHIPDFHEFLRDLPRVLKPRGEFFLETGNIGDLANVREVPTELDLPDHLVFAGEKTIEKFLVDAGFEVLQIERRRKDTLINACKNIVKKAIGRQVTLALPYTSDYRTLLIRAKLKAAQERISVE